MKGKQNSQAAGGSPCRVSPTAERLLRHVTAHIDCRRAALGLVTPERPWIVGFSHGADSTLLLWLLRELARRQPLPALVALHVDHRARPTSADEARRARSFARAAGVPIEIVCLADPPAGETEARAARFAALGRHATAIDASAIWLAHHRDDQLETVLFRWMRGTGPLGLAGIPPLRPLHRDPGSPVVTRPLLGIPGRALRRALADLELPFLSDPSNADPGHTPRNFIRHRLLPEVRRLDPRDRGLRALVREARLLAGAVDAELRSVPVPDLSRGVCEVRVGDTQDLSPWTLERFWSRVLETLGQPVPPRRQLRRLTGLSGARTGTRVEARGRWRASRRRDTVRLETVRAFAPPREGR